MAKRKFIDLISEENTGFNINNSSSSSSSSNTITNIDNNSLSFDNAKVVQIRDFIHSVMKKRGKVVFEENETSVLPMEEMYPEHRDLFFKDNGSSSSNASYNVASGIAKDYIYSPTIRRIVYFRELWDSKYSAVSEDIAPSSKFYKAVLHDVDGHLRSINLLNGNKYIPNVFVTTYRKVIYENGYVEKRPIMSDLVTMENKCM